MKFNIQKLQEGGTTAPWVQYDPFFQPIQQPTQTTTKATTKSSEDGVTKQLNTLLGSMVGKGLTNEINYFSQQIGELLGNYEAMGMPITARAYSGIVAQLNAIQNNKVIYDAARKHATENGTLSSAAITTDGRMYAQTNEGMKLVTPNEYVSNRQRYRLLSNEELLTLRNNSPALIYDTSLSETVGQSVSVDDINKSIDEAVKMIQKEDNSSDLYINKTRAAQFEGALKAIVQGNLGMAPEGNLYKITTSTSTQRAHINTALKRIWEKLPQHAKNTLIAHAAITSEGDPRENAIKSIGELLTYGTYHGEEIKISDEGELLPDGSKGSGSGGSGKTAEINPLDIYAGFKKNRRYTIELGSKYTFTTDAFVAPLVGVDKSIQNNNYLSTILESGGLGGLLNPDGASLGTGIALSALDFTKIIYGSDQVATAWLPCKKDINGNKVLDLEKMEDLEKANEEIEAKGSNITEAEKDEIDRRYKVSHLRLKRELPTQEQLEYLGQFMIIPSYIPQDVAEKYGLNKIMPRLNEDQETEAQELYAHVRAKGANKDVRSSSYEPYSGFWRDHDIYKSSVFIPLQDNVIMRSVVGGNSPTMSVSRLDRSVFEYNQDVATNGPKVNIKGTFGLNK